MQKNIFYIIGFVIFIGCKSIDSIEPNQTETFLKIYGETNNTAARDLLVEDDGYLILMSHDTVSILLKTDLNGNSVWANSYSNFIGNGLAKIDGGYILIGDSINTEATPTTTMKLIKTDLSGNLENSVSLSTGTALVGLAATVASTGDIVALGRQVYTSDVYETTVLMGYSSDLQETWQSYKEYGAVNTLESPYHSIYENPDGSITLATVSVNTQVAFHGITTYPDNESPIAVPKLLEGAAIVNTTLAKGGLVQTPVGYALTQVVNVNGEDKIGVSLFDQTVFNNYFIDTLSFDAGNYIPIAMTNTPNGLLIAGQTDQYKDGADGTRSDKDLFIAEVGYDGKPRTSSMYNTFGGLSDESPVKIRNAPDGGYLILGDLENTKGAVQVFLLKVNSKGDLN